MKKALITIWSFMCVSMASAFHIVGGEIEFITVGGGVYRINLIQYKDEAQVENPGYDDSVLVYVYSNKTNALVSSHVLPLISVEGVFYTNPMCSIDELQTSKVLYSADIQLDPEDYDDEEGYYIEWERCCRNTTIGNIVNPGGTGMKYVVEIPPLWKDGKVYVNSTPSLLKPLSDYACVGQLYYVNFTGIDIDGDSLVYKMATPLNSSSQVALPDPQPKPHIPVTWEDGYSLDSVVPGNPSLSISSKGLLTVKPLNAGLYVFSVIVEEWRNGVKHGEVQRDFQMLVIDGCDAPSPPVLAVQIPGKSDFNPSLDTLKYALSDDKCLEFVVTNLEIGETINLRAEPVNFEGDLSGVFEFNPSKVLMGVDTLLVEVCMPACPPVRGGPFIIDFIAEDDACPLPQMDTVRLMVEVEPPPNTFPEIVSSLSSAYSLASGDALSLEIVATDSDMDSIELVMVIEGVDDPAERGFSFEVIQSEPGLIRAQLRWETDCRQYFFGDMHDFQVSIYAEDRDLCELPSPEFREVDFTVNLPTNTGPQIALTVADSVVVTPGVVLSFDAQAVDADNDTLSLQLISPGFNRAPLGILFSDTSGVGTATSPFLWDIDCQLLDLSSKTDFEFFFVAEDQDMCSEVNTDTLRFVVHVEVPENRKPEFYHYADTSIEVNTPFSMDISAFDLDITDSITIEFFNPARLPRSPSLQMEPVTGVSEVTATLEWTPECSLLDLGQTSAYYDLVFLVYDNSCPVAKFDTMMITFELRETRDQFVQFIPPNVFTPNNDAKNDVFTLTNLRNPSYNLPRDNCDDTFQSITILDRNGSKVFTSPSREFVWDGGGAHAGVYYYVIRYSRTEYKGYLHLLR